MDSKITGNLLPRLQRILDRLLELFRVRLDVGTEAGDQLTVRSDQELIEVPTYRPGVAGILAGKLLKERVRVVTLDGDLSVHGERDLEVRLAELLDVLVRGRLLPPKVIAREAGDDEALGFEVIIQRLESVILTGVAALAGDIDDKPGLAALEGAERGRLAVDILYRDAKESEGFVFRVQGGHENCQSQGEESHEQIVA